MADDVGQQGLLALVEQAPQPAREQSDEDRADEHRPIGVAAEELRGRHDLGKNEGAHRAPVKMSSLMP